VPFDLSMGEVLLVLFVALLVFGGKLPDTARKVGSALSEFKRGMREELRKVEDGVRHDAPPPEWRPPKIEPPAGPPAEPTRRDP
jgi:TatA/E family protein of Tat protein translocase